MDPGGEGFVEITNSVFGEEQDARIILQRA